jgi:UDP-3-O-[3-hydroxymyristoyl] glucosamine N-acyltransferase
MKVREIAEILGGELVGDGETEIFRVADLSRAGENEIAFLANSTAVSNATSASCFIVGSREAAERFSSAIVVQAPKLAFARIASLLHPPKLREAEIHSSAVIAANATIGTDVFIGAFACVGENSTVGKGTQLRAGAKIGDDVKVGDRCVIHPNVFIEDGCTIGNDVVLHAGVIVGADGFGYVQEMDGSHVKFPQVGTVVIEDDVEIGANSCIDRGALGETRIGAGTKIDNLVQIAHNVQIGKRVLIAAQTGISGSCLIEDDCVIGGQVGFGDHATIKSGTVIGSQAGVLPGKILRPGVWWGTPAQPLEEFKRQHAHLKRIEKLRSDVEELKSRVRKITDGDQPS